MVIYNINKYAYLPEGILMTNLEVEAFLSIVKTGSITKAAESLFVTQPALSRRIKALETELGYSLISRRKGVRKIELTDEGRAFTSIAEKWRLLWQETKGISGLEKSDVLNVASMDSVSTYVMSGLYRSFLLKNHGINLSIRTFHAYEAYGYVESGLIDVAFVSDDVSVDDVVMVPVFKESMLFVCSENAEYPEVVHPSELDPSKQIKIPWNLEYDTWHRQWFNDSVFPRVFLDKMSLFEEFLFWENNWAIVPASVAQKVREKVGDIVVRKIADGPGDRIIYYLLGRHRKKRVIDEFLTCTKEYLSNIDCVTLLV